MAKGKGSKLGVVLVVLFIGLICALLSALGLVNPLSPLNVIWKKITTLSNPAPAWQTRPDGVPDLAGVLADGAVVSFTRGFVQVYQASGGALLWKRDVNFALPANDVVVIQQRSDNPDVDPSPDAGYAVVDPVSGAVLWSDRDAQAVWAWSDYIVDLTCSDQCVMRARSHHASGTIAWEVTLPNEAKIIRGGNPGLAGTRDPAQWFAKAAAGLAGPMPAVIALPVNDTVHLIDTVNGVYVRGVQAPNRDTMVAFSGDRLLDITAKRATAGCVFSVDAYDFQTMQLAWHNDGYDLGTASGAGCEQRDKPFGTGGQLVVTGADDRPRLVTSDAAREAWVGVAGEKVLASDGRLAVVSGADRQTLSVVNVTGDASSVVWTGQFGLDAQAAITPDLVIIRDADAEKLIVFRKQGMVQKLELKTQAGVAAAGPSGLLLVDGRTIGYVPVAR